MTQSVPLNWNLDRIDQYNLPLDGNFSYAYTGKGVEAYILDSGVRETHTDFGGRVRCGWSAVSNHSRLTPQCWDNEGHGTHIAGTVGGATYGVAKNVSLIAVRMSDEFDNVTLSYILQSFCYVWYQKLMRPKQPMVINISWYGPASSAMDAAVRKLGMWNVITVTCAGNEPDVSAWDFSPARSRWAITVGGTDSDDVYDNYTSWGTCVDVLAPSINILSAAKRNDTHSRIMTGTSMSAALVSGGKYIRICRLYLPQSSKVLNISVAQELFLKLVLLLDFCFGSDFSQNSHWMDCISHVNLSIAVVAIYLEKFPYATFRQVKSYLMATAIPGIITDIPFDKPVGNRLVSATSLIVP